MKFTKRDGIWAIMVLMALVLPAVANTIMIELTPSKYTDDSMTKVAQEKAQTKTELVEADFTEYMAQKYNPLASKLMLHCSRIVASGDDELMLSAEASLKEVYDITPPEQKIKAISGLQTPQSSQSTSPSTSSEQ